MTYKMVRIAFLFLGFSLLYGVVKKIGWASIETQVAGFRWNLLPILSIGFFWYLCYTLAWAQILKQQNIKIPFWSLFKARVACDTASTMTPVNFLGGDTMRIYLLHQSSNVTSLAATVVVDRTINSIAIVAVIFAGAIAAFLTLPGLPHQVAVGIPAFLIFSTTLIVFFLFRQHKGLFASILRLAQRLPIATSLVQKYRHKAEELDKKVLGVYQKSHKTFWIALFYHMAGRLFGVLEVYMIGKTMTHNFTMLIALLLATLAPIINMAFTFIPGALGVLEGVYSGALYLLGLPAALGLTIQIIKRIRAGIWMGLGLGFISFRRHHRRAAYNKGPLQQPL